MWLLFAVGSAFFAGVTSILAKCGIRKTDSTVATALRTIVVLIMAVLMRSQRIPLRIFMPRKSDRLSATRGQWKLEQQDLSRRTRAAAEMRPYP